MTQTGGWQDWRCPECGGLLQTTLFTSQGQPAEGCLRCNCGMRFPVVEGIPRLFRDAWQRFPGFVRSHQQSLAAIGGIPPLPVDASSSRDRQLARTRESFGYQWTRFGEMVCDFEGNFLNYLWPLERGFFRNKRGLDAGCGFGRHLINAAKLGAQITGIDLSQAIEVSARNSRGLENVSLAQADIYRPPFAPATFDFVYSIGVLHHLPDPEAAFQRLVPLVKPGGTMAIWVYSKHRRLSRWLLEALRGISVRLPHRWVQALSWLAAAVEWAAYIGPCRLLMRQPSLAAWAKRWIPRRVQMYAAYPFQVSYADWFDRLAAPIRFYYTEKDLQGWFARAGLEDVRISATDRYGLRAVGVRPAAVAAAPAAVSVAG